MSEQQQQTLTDAPEGQWACPKCTLYNDMSLTQCSACQEPRKVDNKDAVGLSKEDEEKLEEAQEALSSLFAMKKPAHAGQGLSQGVGNLVKGVAGGATAMVALPVMGARKGGVGGFMAGLGAGVVVGGSMMVAGVGAGVVQSARGVANSPAAVAAASSGKEWDQEQGKWILYKLPEEASTVLNMTDQDYLESLKKKSSDGSRVGQEGGGDNANEDGGEQPTPQEPELPEKHVKDTELYDLLGVKPNVPAEKIKRAYYIQARKCHPDKNADDPEAHTKFQKLGEAYQILSDPDQRAKYDQHGKEGVNDNQVMDPGAMFAMLFGSERFRDYIGEFRMATLATLQEEHGEGRNFIKLQAFRQKQREVTCAVALAQKLSQFVEGAADRFEAELKEEAVDLAAAPFGGHMLQSIGYIYDEQSSKFLGNPINSALTGMKANARSANTQYKVVKSGMKAYNEAMKLQKEGHKLESGEEEAEMTPEQSVKLMEAMLEAVWQSNVLDLDSTLRKVCHKVLFDKSVDKPTRKLRARGLALMGKIFLEASAGRTDTTEEIRRQMMGEMPTPTEIGPGAHVKLQGLNSEEFNGQVGIVVGEEVDGRFPIFLESTSATKSIKKENLELVTNQ